MAAEFPQKTVMVMLKGSDYPAIIVEEAVARQSPVIKNMIESRDFKENDPINLPGEITSAILSKVMMEYCKKHVEARGTAITSDVTSGAKASLAAACTVCWETMDAYDSATALKEKADRLKYIAACLEKAGKDFCKYSESMAAVAGRFDEDGLNEWDHNFVDDMDVATLINVLSAAEYLGIDGLRVLVLKTLREIVDEN